MKKKIFFCFVTVLTVLFSMSLYADGYQNCQNSIRDQVYQNNPKAQKVEFEVMTESAQERLGDQSKYRGNGRFLRQSGELEQFNWECTYNERNSIVIEAHYSVLETGSAASVNWTDECHASIRDRIQNENEGVGKVAFSNTKESRFSDHEQLIEGRGSVVLKGKDQIFSYQCLRNNRTNQITDKKYELK